MWNDVIEKIRAAKRVVITTHVNPDGDAIGSEMALAAWLEDIGKTVTIVNSSSTPQSCTFMDPDGGIRVYPKSYDPDILKNADLAIMVDVSTWNQTGSFGAVLRKSNAARMVIDHHQGPDSDIADVIVIDTSAAAVGVLIYEMIKSAGGEITQRVADAVYAAIITDTGTFRFSNTDERVFRIATELAARGINPFLLHRNLFAKTAGAVKLLGKVFTTIDSTEDGRLAWIHVTRDMFKQSGADYEDSDGLLDLVRQTKGVEFCLFFKELRDGNVKVSLRSNGNVDVYEIARTFGGGGHRMASGMTVPGPLKEAIRSVVKTARTYLP